MTTDTEALTYDHIVALALSNGFKLKPQSDGRMALNDYVIGFARAVYDIGHAAAKSETAAAVEKEMERCIGIIESHRIPVGNSAAGEMACEWTYDALKTIRDAIRAGAPPDTPREAGAVAGGAA